MREFAFPGFNHGKARRRVRNDRAFAGLMKLTQAIIRQRTIQYRSVLERLKTSCDWIERKEFNDCRSTE
jgi:hypothetical protein